MNEILKLFPMNVRNILQEKIAHQWGELQEIRVRLYKPIELIFNQHIEWIKSIIPNENLSTYMINQLSEYSLYRMEDELKEGYITIEGGHRVGLAGEVNTLDGSVKAIQTITFLNIRIAKEKKGVAKPIIPYIHDKKYLNTLLIGPPLTGKTTLLRDFIRLISTGWRNISPKKVGVVDERSEIGAAKRGIPQNDLGLRTDLLDRCPKAEGMMMLIRSMSPEVIVVDEIGSKNDVLAIMEAMQSGVTVLCSIHGQSLEELKNRPSLDPIFQEEIFKRFIILHKSKIPGKIKSILNSLGDDLWIERGKESYEVDWRSSFYPSNNVDRF